MASGRRYYVVERKRCLGCNGTRSLMKICPSCFGTGDTVCEVPFRQALVEALGSRELLQALRTSLAALETQGETHAHVQVHKQEPVDG